MTRREIRVRRVYDRSEPDDGVRVLVDRVWPRGLRKDGANLDGWTSDVAPSTELRKWYGHDPEKFDEFRSHRCELESPTRRAALEHLRTFVESKPLALFTDTTDVEHSNATVLAELFREDQLCATSGSHTRILHVDVLLDHIAEHRVSVDEDFRGHCCIDSKGTSATRRDGQADPSSTLKTVQPNTRRLATWLLGGSVERIGWADRLMRQSPLCSPQTASAANGWP